MMAGLMFDHYGGDVIAGNSIRATTGCRLEVKFDFHHHDADQHHAYGRHSGIYWRHARGSVDAVGNCQPLTLPHHPDRTTLIQHLRPDTGIPVSGRRC